MYNTEFLDCVAIRPIACTVALREAEIFVVVKFKIESACRNPVKPLDVVPELMVVNEQLIDFKFAT